MAGCTPKAEPQPGTSAALVQQERLQRIVDGSLDLSWRTMLRLGLNAADAEDAVQQVFIIVARKLASIAEGSERSFVFATSLRVASTMRRTQRRRREELPGDFNEQVASGPSPELAAHQGRLLGLLGMALESLPLPQRQVFMLHELEQWTLTEIAELLRIPSGTAASRLRRARRAFERRVAELSPSAAKEAP